MPSSSTSEWADQWWDEERGLLWNPPGSFDAVPASNGARDYGMQALSMHMVPQSAWYAVDCLQRGLDARARRIVDELAALQYDEPGTIWHGTFARFAEWPHPGSHERDIVEWIDYDPNWRQFIGTTFRLIEKTWGWDLHEPIDLAIAGEPRDRVSPAYSNIALMKAWLEADETFAEEVVRLFEVHGAFAEYNSPTYYGIDLYALALWRVHPPTPRFAEWAERVESALWRDLARWYHPGLRNLCGPYSRAYGMDMTAYVALLGMWLPDPVLPDVAQPFEHSHDLLLQASVDVLGGGPEHVDWDRGLVSQRITDDRVATGWLGDDVMLGAEEGGHYRAQGQYHPATAHWARPSGGGSGKLGWLRVRSPNPVNAMVYEPGVLEVEGNDLTIEQAGTFPGDIETTDEGLVVRVSRSR